jgi:hypothetical protein
MQADSAERRAREFAKLYESAQESRSQRTKQLSKTGQAAEEGLAAIARVCGPSATQRVGQIDSMLALIVESHLTAHVDDVERVIDEACAIKVAELDHVFHDGPKIGFPVSQKPAIL